MGYPVIHCIHDPARIDRMSFLQIEIDKHNLLVRFWPAIKDPWMTFRGVSQAHKQIVRWAKREGLSEVLISEDDFFLYAPGAFDYFLEKKPEEYDLYLGNIFWGSLNPPAVGDFCGLTLYFVHSRFYDRFLSVKEENHLDRVLGRMDAVKIVCDPMVCSQRDGYSDNKKAEGHYEKYMANYNIYGRK